MAGNFPFKLKNLNKKYRLSHACLLITYSLTKLYLNMNHQDFKRLNGLLAKLSVAADKAAREDGSFRKYHTNSIDALKAMRIQLTNLERGLHTAKIIQAPRPAEVSNTIALGSAI